MSAFCITSGWMSAEAQQAQPQLVLAMYAPTLPFRDTSARSAYLKNLARAISANIGRSVEPRLYNSMAQLKKSSPDFAIVEAQCADTGSWRTVAIATIGGKSSRAWALLAARGVGLSALRGKRLAYATAGCRDDDFIENVLFRSELRVNYFGATKAKSTLSGAVAEVAVVKAADAVVAPVNEGGSLTKVFDAGVVPNPVFVVMNTGLGSSLIDQIGDTVRKFGSSGAVDGWSGASSDLQADLRRRLRPVRKEFVLADAPSLTIPYRDLFDTPKTTPAVLSVKSYFDSGDVPGGKTAAPPASSGKAAAPPAAPPDKGGR